jgi:signal transduction histidine kinase
VVAAQEVERRRLARELHDQTGQTLTSIMLGLKSVEERLGGDPIGEEVAALGGQVASAMQDVRRIALELRPKALDDFGLVSALERLTATFSVRTGIVVDLEARLASHQRLTPEIETALYRIVQEGLTNMAKHAEPSRASVLVTPKNGSVLLVLEDNGRGFDPSTPRGGLGLDGMRERVELLEGRLTIESSPEAGTTLVVEVPVR